MRSESAHEHSASPTRKPCSSAERNWLGGAISARLETFCVYVEMRVQDVDIRVGAVKVDVITSREAQGHQFSF